MGTSQSSGGPGPGVPMVPPWTPEPPADEQPANPAPAFDPAEGEEGQAGPAEPRLPPDRADEPDGTPQGPLAPPARFLGVRRGLGDYARTGDRNDLGRSLGHYVRTGYGGSRTASRRFGGTATTAVALGTVLSRLASGQTTAPDSAIDSTLLAGQSAQQVMDAVVEAVRPIDGTQDAEAERASIRDALSELLTRYPEADLLNLDPEQRGFAIEKFAAIDVYRRFHLDVGKAIVEKAPSAVTALARLKEARDYIKQHVSASFRKLRDAGRTVTAGRVGQVVRDALRETFEVFEGYAE